MKNSVLVFLTMLAVILYIVSTISVFGISQVIGLIIIIAVTVYLIIKLRREE